MKAFLTCSIALATLTATSAWAVETSTVGSQTNQSNVNVLNSKIDTLAAQLQALVSGMSNCSAQRKFYAPSDPRRDASNCVAQGAYEFTSTGVNSGDYGQLRMVGYGSGAFWRNDGTTTYLLMTNTGDPNGSWNSLRPFYVTNATGYVNMSQGVAVTGGLAATTGDGNWAITANANGTGLGVYGHAANNWSGYFTGLNGVYGTGTSGIGVQGSSASNWAGWFSGSSGAAGVSNGGWAGYFHSQGTQNGVYITNNSGNANLCLNGSCITSWPTSSHLYGGDYTTLNSSCFNPNTYTGDCSCPSGFNGHHNIPSSVFSNGTYTFYTCY